MRLRRHPVAVALAGAAWLAACGRFVPGLVPASLAVFGWAVTRWSAARITGDPSCRRLLEWAYLARVGLAVALRIPALHAWPGLSDYYGRDGFWVFADDAQAHHIFALRIMEYWRGEGQFPTISFSNWSYVAYVVGLYRVLGAHPLNVAFLNAWYGVAAALAAWWLLDRIGASAPVKRFGAALFAFWPSLMLWSSQPLKDQPALTLIMFSLAALVSLVQERAVPWRRFAAWLGALAVLVVLLSVVREYAATAFLLTTLLGCGVAICRAVSVRAWMPALQLALVGGVVWWGSWVGPRVDVGALLAAPPVEVVAVVDEPKAAEAPETVEAASLAQPAGPEPHAAMPGAVSDLLDQIKPARIAGLREGFVSTGGESLFRSDADLHTPFMMLRHLFPALAQAVLGPFPTQWSSVDGRTGFLRLFAILEALLVYALLLAPFLGGRIAGRLRLAPILLIACFGLLVGAPMSIAVANFGTLFRLRLQFLLPLLLLACLANPAAAYRKLWHRVR